MEVDKRGTASEELRYILPENVNLRFYFSPHGSAEDAPHLKEEMANADVFAPEILAWTPPYKKTFDQISRGNYGEYQLLKDFLRRNIGPDSYSELQISALYGKRIPVIFFDLERNHPLTEAHDYYVMQPLVLAEAMQAGNDFAAAMQIMTSGYKEKAGPLIRQREEYMIANIHRGIDQMLKQNPRLRSKDAVNVLVSLGSDHTHVYHTFKKANASSDTQVTREFNEMPVIYSHQVQCLRAGQFGTPISEHMVAHAYAELVIGSIFSKLGSLAMYTPSEKHKIDMQISESLTIDDISELHAYYFPNVVHLGQDIDTTHPVISKVIASLVEYE